MRRLVFVLGLTACYQPGGVEAPCTVLCGAASACPGDLVCNRAMNLCALANGSCSMDAGIDGPDLPDGQPPGPMCSVPPTVVTPVMLTTGRWYVVDPMSGRGVKARGQTMLGTTMPDTTSDQDFVDLGLPRPAMASFYGPRLAPGGDALYLTMQYNDSATTIVMSTRDPGGVWSPVVTQMLIDEDSIPIPLFGDEVASPPTTTAPRRMLVSSTILGSVLDEYVEAGLNQWQRLRRQPTQFLGVEYIGQATLSHEGRRMVFLGRVVGDVPQGFYVERPSVTVAFPAVATKIPVNSSGITGSPYLTSDCKHYYFTDANEQILHATFP